MWLKTRVFAPGSDQGACQHALNMASLKDSYANYAAEANRLHGKSAMTAS